MLLTNKKICGGIAATIYPVSQKTGHLILAYNFGK